MSELKEKQPIELIEILKNVPIHRHEVTDGFVIFEMAGGRVTTKENSAAADALEVLIELLSRYPDDLKKRRYYAFKHLQETLPKKDFSDWNPIELLAWWTNRSIVEGSMKSRDVWAKDGSFTALLRVAGLPLPGSYDGSFYEKYPYPEQWLNWMGEDAARWLYEFLKDATSPFAWNHLSELGKSKPPRELSYIGAVSVMLDHPDGRLVKGNRGAFDDSIGKLEKPDINLE